jgi:hypothetical protein
MWNSTEWSSVDARASGPVSRVRRGSGTRGALVHVAQHHWWPIIPGGILVLVAAASIIGDQAVQLLDD